MQEYDEKHRRSYHTMIFTVRWTTTLSVFQIHHERHHYSTHTLLRDPNPSNARSSGNKLMRPRELRYHRKTWTSGRALQCQTLQRRTRLLRHTPSPIPARGGIPARPRKGRAQPPPQSPPEKRTRQRYRGTALEAGNPLRHHKTRKPPPTSRNTRSRTKPASAHHTSASRPVLNKVEIEMIVIMK